MYIIVEGLDKTGKGTAEVGILKRLNYKPIIMDRGPAGYQLFNEFFKRNSEETYEEEYKLIQNTKLYKTVYLYCDPETFYERTNKNNERILYDYEGLEARYRQLVTEKYPDPIIINTSKYNIQETIDKIMEKLLDD